MQVKGEAYKTSNAVGAHKEQSSDREELPFTQRCAKQLTCPSLTRMGLYQPMKNMGRAIEVLYNRSQEDKTNPKEQSKPAVPNVSQATQITPNRTAVELSSNKIVREKDGDL